MGVIKYCPYVDYAYALFNNENKALQFVTVQTNQQIFIRFTIPFLDVEIIFDDNEITSRPYRKLKLITSWKVGLIKNMITVIF